MEITPDIMVNCAEDNVSANATMKRKPIFTYKSPAADDPDPVITLPSRRRATPQMPLETSPDEQHRPPISHPTVRSQRKRTRIMGYSPSLYHPLGKLALSLPPLDPSIYGLPLPNNFVNNNNTNTKPAEQSSSRQPGNEMGGETALPTVSSIAAVAANEVRRAGTRRRRMGAFGVKRRRKEVDDGDATYPAKRSRQSRLGNQAEEITLEGDTEGTPEPTAVDGPAERRRSTRTRTAKRRESSEGGSADEQPPPSSAQYAMQGDTMINEEAEEGDLEDGQIK